MGITIVSKSKRPKPNAVKALILAGGAITGGSFKAGGIKALNDYLTNFKVTDFDIYVGISSGSLLAAPLMGGISPESILRSLYGTSRHFSLLSLFHYYRPNISEWILRPMSFFAKLSAIPLKILSGKDIDLPQLASILPSGVFDNSSIEKYLRENIEKNGLINDFKKAHKMTGKRLYICATALDGARPVIFGPDEKNDVTISEAVQASTAMPGFYKPARINGIDYVDGGVQETANIGIAVKKGAQLIVCYNPFRPYDPAKDGRLTDGGAMAVLNQIFRAFFHTRLHAELNHFRNDPSFKGDIILIEPRADDAAFFELNPLALSNRIRAARLGFESVRNSIEEHFDKVRAVFAKYKIKMERENVEKEFEKITKPNALETEIQALLEGKKRRKNGTKRIKI